MKAIKKIVVTLSLLLLGSVVYAQDSDDININPNQLPSKSLQFVKKHFKSSVSNAVKDMDYGRVSEYQVYLQDGTKIDFGRNGDWKDVESFQSEVPSAIVPAKISSYVKNNYSGNRIQKIEKERFGYSVKLSNGIELDFGKAGQFLKIDD